MRAIGRVTGCKRLSSTHHIGAGLRHMRRARPTSLRVMDVAEQDNRACGRTERQQQAGHWRAFAIPALP